MSDGVRNEINIYELGLSHGWGPSYEIVGCRFSASRGHPIILVNNGTLVEVPCPAEDKCKHSDFWDAVVVPILADHVKLWKRYETLADMTLSTIPEPEGYWSVVELAKAA